MIKTKKTIVFLACLLGAAVPVSVYPQIITLQAEIYTASHDIAYDLIGSVGGYLYGLDYPDEWTEYDLVVSSYGYYSAQMLLRGELNVPYSLRLILTADGSGDTQTCDFAFVGTGMT